MRLFPVEMIGMSLPPVKLNCKICSALLQSVNWLVAPISPHWVLRSPGHPADESKGLTKCRW
jgi:hypothetical protein